MRSARAIAEDPTHNVLVAGLSSVARAETEGPGGGKFARSWEMRISPREMIGLRDNIGYFCVCSPNVLFVCASGFSGVPETPDTTRPRLNASASIFEPTK